MSHRSDKETTHVIRSLASPAAGVSVGAGFGGIRGWVAAAAVVVVLSALAWWVASRRQR